MTDTFTIARPDDWHLHLRDGAMMEAIAPESARHFARAIVMPNLVPPVVTKADADAYRTRILAALPKAARFRPLMTLYLTEETDADDVAAAFSEDVALAVKLYPAGATTNSQSGVRDMDKVMGVLERMAEIGMTLCVHGEVTDRDVDIFDREAVFIERVLAPLRERLPELRITMEHVTTSDAVDYVTGASGNLAASITTHHLMINRNAIFAGGVRPHYYCLPIAKRERHRKALRRAATGGDPRFFLGTDSAPHAVSAKENACGCAGIFTATNTMSCLAHVFEEENALPRLEAFVAHHGADWYRQPRNAATITLRKGKTPHALPKTIATGAGDVVLFDPEMPMYWTVEED